MNQPAQLADFSRKLSSYLQDYEQLTVARGISFPEDAGEVSPEGFFSSLSSLYPEKRVRVLFYGFVRAHGRQTSLHIFLTGPQGVIASRMSAISPGQIETLIRELKHSLQVAERIAGQATVLRSSFDPAIMMSARPVAQVSEEIAAHLFPEDWVSELTRTDHLIIFPAENIGAIPFALLPLAGQPLIDHCSLSVASDVYDLFDSVSKIQSGKKTKIRTFARPLIVGNPRYPAGGEVSFADLPGAAEEARYIAQLIGRENGLLLLGKSATKAAVVAGAEKADLLFFGTHGISSPENSLDNSYLVLSQDSEGGPETAYWTAREIQSMHLKADLAVLSACQSGLGVSHEAGIIGLARAFRLAGVDHVIMSLWNVSDDATQELMKLLFHELLTHPEHSPAVALRNAQLALRISRPEPIHWAAFVTFGLP